MCLIMLHSPDKSLLWIEAAHIVTIRPVDGSGHVAPGAKTLVYGAGSRVYGVTEDANQIIAEIRQCEEERP